ncbi:MAG: ribokinase [Spirochaetaceae bacterium]|jgi:ribokinase|nr:ribokinase [Spirochaetaceae bacterium]
MAKKIICLGSFVVDLTCRVDRLPLPGETLISDYFKMGPGGKGANQAVAAKRAGGNIILMTKIGRDLLSQVALHNFKQEGFDERYIIVAEDFFTGIALINVDKNTSENSIVVAPGACAHITSADIALLEGEIASGDIFLTQLEVNIDAIERAVRIAADHKKIIVMNTAPARKLSDEFLSRATIITPNESEAFLLTGVAVADKSSAGKAARVFFDKGIKNVVITLGKKGCYVNDGKIEEIIEPVEVPTIDTTGAGDAFTGGLVVALAEDRSLLNAVKFATCTAALSTTKMGTAPSMPYRTEIDALVKKAYGRL